VREVHRFRSQLRIAPSVRLELDVEPADAAAREVLTAHAGLVRSLAGLGRIDVVDALEDLPGSSSIVFAVRPCERPARGRHRPRGRDRPRARGAGARARRRRAPRCEARERGVRVACAADVVAKEREKLQAAERVVEELTARLASFGVRP
jgi:valyl-tRNA synthetase